MHMLMIGDFWYGFMFVGVYTGVLISP